MDNKEWKITDNNIDKITLNYKKKQCIRKRQQGLNILRIISPIILSFCFSCVLLLDITEYKNTYLINFIAPIHNSVCSLFNCSPKIGYLILAILSLCIEILFSITLKRTANREPDISIDNDKTLIEKAQYLYNFAKNEKSDGGEGWIVFLMFLQLVGIIYVGIFIIPFSEIKGKALEIIFLYALAGFVLFIYYGFHFPDNVLSYEFCKKCEDYLKEKRAEEDARIKAEEKAKRSKRANEIFSIATSGEQIDYQKLEEAARLGHKEAATILAKRIYDEIYTELRTSEERDAMYQKIIEYLSNIDDLDGDGLFIRLESKSNLSGFTLDGWKYYLETLRRFKKEHSIEEKYYDILDREISSAISMINRMSRGSDDIWDRIHEREQQNAGQSDDYFLDDLGSMMAADYGSDWSSGM